MGPRAGGQGCVPEVDAALCPQVAAGLSPAARLCGHWLGSREEEDTAAACATATGLCRLARRPSSACSSHTVTREHALNTVTLGLVTCEVSTLPT